MIEFLRKFENRSIKIARVNSIRITKSINVQLFTLILYGFLVRCDLRRFSVLSQFIEKSMLCAIPISELLLSLNYFYLRAIPISQLFLSLSYSSLSYSYL